MSWVFAYDDLVAQGVLAPRLLNALLHMQGRSTPSLIPLRDALTLLGGEMMVGREPGSSSYEPSSVLRFVRTAALSTERTVLDDTADTEGVLPYAYDPIPMRPGDIVVAKDGPVGQVGIYMGGFVQPPMVSSGFLRIRVPSATWFYYGVLKYGPFRADIDLVTPTGSTFRHAGRRRIEDYLVPRIGRDADLELRVSLLGLISVDSERQLRQRFNSALTSFDQFLGTEGLSVRSPALSPATPSVSDILGAERTDARFHAAQSSPLKSAWDSRGYSSLAGRVASGEITSKRGQNLQYTSIGFCRKHDDATVGDWRLLEPNFIEKDMSLPRYRWLWCPRKLQTVDDGAVIMSAEGSVGNVAVFRETPGLQTVSNIHALILDWPGRDREYHNAWLAVNLAYLREKGWLDAVSVGGQGGSLAVKYHGHLPIFDFPSVEGPAVAKLVVGGPRPPTAAALLAMSTRQLASTLRSLRQYSLAALDELRRESGDAVTDLLRLEYPELF